MLESNDERQPETPNDVSSSSEIPGGSSRNKRKQKNKSTSAVKKPKTAAAPKEQWRTAHDWLEYHNVNGKILMFCTMCEQAGYKNQMAKGLGTYKKDLVDRHVKNQEHVFLENAKKTGQQNIVQILSQNLISDKEKIINQMKCVYFLAKNHLSLNLYSEICNLVLNINKYSEPSHLQLPPLSSLNQYNESINTSQYRSYQNPRYARKFEEAITYIIEKALINEIKASGQWSILIDESTTVSEEKHLVIISKHMTNNVPVLRYLGLIELDDCSANNITT